jgi:hypothetical protein
MAQETGAVMDAVQRQAAALARGRGPARTRLLAVEEQVLPDGTDTEEAEIPEETEAGTIETPEEGVPEDGEPTEALEAVQGQAAIARVKALLTEALRLGVQYHLIEKQPDGALLLAGQVRQARRESSDCTCAKCTPYSQQHWICVVCHSGPHDWLMVKPQFERQALKAGGIEGTRHAACSQQCARDYLQGLGRQPAADLPMAQGLDPTLALPG